MKKISFASKPEGRGPTADQWVRGQVAKEPIKRLTVDVPLSLHRRIKTQCVLDDLIIADVVRDLLEKRFPEEKRAKDGATSMQQIASS